jgi:hypothetical protein
MIYEIRDYVSNPGLVVYLTELTDDVLNCDFFVFPADFDMAELVRFGLINAPKQFTDKAEAEHYLNICEKVKKYRRKNTPNLPICEFKIYAWDPASSTQQLELVKS